ncbi:flagellar motor switch protein FliN [Buchnera aphidicola]|uniref:Flagellar motor switch protein FliN n=1 Tax=Buchnera aphidicola (Cinara curvipes) TaxID=2518975 RepID=A0A451D687_9GAMM|nr:flagellar motor switch protein FliN [Buchnera aphidicola]VFP81348.1 Flagellar motor switch protein FliN [Buchnera aphidicola (Cinara curvipes)]
MNKKNEKFEKDNLQSISSKVNLDNNLNNTYNDSLKKKKIENINFNKKIINDVFEYKKSIISIPVSVTIELGKKKITIKELLKLSTGSILELEDKVDEPLNIFVNKNLVALGELVVHNKKYGVRIIKLL